MNSKTYRRAAVLGLCGTLLLGARLAALADANVTFQVDMSVALTNGTFNPGTQTVAVRGKFTGWGTAFVQLTNNPSAVNPNLYTGTTNILTAYGTNGTPTDYKFTLEGGGSVYETTADNNNRVFVIPANNGGSLTNPVSYFSDTPPTPPGPETNAVTFLVDMAQQINIGAFNPSTDTVYAKGTFNGFSTSLPMTNNPSIRTTNSFGAVTTDVWEAVTNIECTIGSQVEYKYFIDNGNNWENPAVGDPDNSENRWSQYPGGPVAFPIVYFSDTPYAPTYTNNVTFQVDMSVQVAKGNFDPNSATVEARGSFNNWGNPQLQLTNNPNAANPDLYTGVFPIIAGKGTTPTISYKYWASDEGNGGWELPASTGGNNRSFVLQQASQQTLTAVYYNDAGPSSGLSQNCLVTFRVSMTNAIGTDSYVFNPSVDFVAVNGVTSLDHSGFWGWAAAGSESQVAAGGPGIIEPAEFDMTNYPVGSEIYQVQVTIPAGAPFAINYKYGIDAVDNEAGFAQNHQRYIRADTGSYVLPLDTFGNQLVEIPFGNLTIGSPSGGTIPVTWLGLPNVHLQTSTDLGAGFTDHPETAGMSSTNYPVGPGATFFRLYQKQ